MLDKLYVVKKLQELLPPAKRANSGWLNFNCVMCHVNGEPTRDKHRKGNIIFAGASFTYRCWRCKFKAHYKVGMPISHKLTLLFKQLGMSDKDLLDLKLYVNQINQLYTVDDEENNVIQDDIHEFKHIALPDNAIELKSSEGGDFLNNQHFCQVVQYAYNRGEQIYSSELYWSPKYPTRLIIPFKYNGNIVGYTSRWAGTPPKNQQRYITRSQEGFLFNNHFLDSKTRRYVVLTEGPFDALAINGVAYLKDTLSAKQLTWLRNTDMEKILVPDRGKSSLAAIEQVMEEGWSVSMPDWDKGIKDVHDAYMCYGALYTVTEILKQKTDNETKIRMTWKNWHKR